jgi:hypothetical protein
VELPFGGDAFSGYHDSSSYKDSIASSYYSYIAVRIDAAELCGGKEIEPTILEAIGE